MSWAVRFEDVSKRYPAATWGYASLRDDLTRLARSLAASLRGRRAAPPERAALDHVSFEVEQGEPFAIIGPTGLARRPRSSSSAGSRFRAPAACACGDGSGR